MIINLLIILSVFIVSKTMYNLHYLLLIKWYYKKYLELVKGTDSWFIREHRQKIVQLFQNAGIHDATQPITEPAGFGLVRSSSFSVFRNLSVLESEVVAIVNGDFREAIGVYKQRVFESFSPIWWFEMIIYLPKRILIYLGIKESSSIIKLFQIVWWIIGAVSTLIGIFFNREFTSWIQGLNL